MQKPRVWSLGREDPLEEGMATHSSILWAPLIVQSVKESTCNAGDLPWVSLLRHQVTARDAPGVAAAHFHGQPHRRCLFHLTEGRAWPQGPPGSCEHVSCRGVLRSPAPKRAHVKEKSDGGSCWETTTKSLETKFTKISFLIFQKIGTSLTSHSAKNVFRPIWSALQEVQINLH